MSIYPSTLLPFSTSKSIRAWKLKITILISRKSPFLIHGQLLSNRNSKSQLGCIKQLNKYNTKIFPMVTQCGYFILNQAHLLSFPSPTKSKASYSRKLVSYLLDLDFALGRVEDDVEMKEDRAGV